METAWDKILKVLVAIGGAIASVLGGWDWILTVFIVFMAADYLSGILVASMNRSLKTDNGGLSSKVGWKGLCRKGLMILVVLLSAMLDRVVPMEESIVRDTVCWFYIANEGISIMENLILAGVPFPKFLKKLFEAKLAEDDANQPDDGK